MPKANRARNQKLSKEELREENKRIKEELSHTTEYEGQQRILDILSKENWIAYLLAAFLPPIGIWYIWKKKEKHKLTFAAMITWTMIAVIITVEWIRQIIEWYTY